MRFKERIHLHHIEVQSEASSSLEYLVKIIDEGGYAKQQIVRMDKNTTTPEDDACRTFTAREKSSGFKSSEDGLALFLGANNTYGDFNLKSMLSAYLSFKIPNAPKNYTKSTLAVLYKWNNKAC
jgi:hypothetical protein